MPRIDFTKELFKDDPAETINLADFVPAEVDAEPYVKEFEKHERRILAMAKQVTELVIEDDASLEIAVAMGSTAAKAVKELENQRKSIVKPYNDFVKTVNRACKMYVGKIQDLIIKLLKDKIGAFKAERELAQRKAQEQARKEAERLDAMLKKDAKKAGVEAPDVPIPKVKDAAVGPTQTAPGTGYTQKRWTYEIEDINKVPRDYMKLDEGAVTRAIRAGEREIPGLRIFQKSGVAFRTG